MMIFRVQGIEHRRIWRVNSQVVERMLPDDVIWGAPRNLFLDLRQKLALTRGLHRHVLLTRMEGQVQN